MPSTFIPLHLYTPIPFTFRTHISRVAERIGTGLQHLLRWFESNRGVEERVQGYKEYKAFKVFKG